MSALPPNPAALLYPGAWYPRNDPPYDTAIPGDFLYPSFSFFPSSRKKHVTIVYGRTDREVVGTPHPGLHPRPRLLPGTDNIPVTYQRIHYPGAAVLPNRSLYPYKEGTHIATSYTGQVAVLNSTMRFRPVRLGAAAAGVARFVLRARFDIFGVLASDSDRKLRTVVELGTIMEGIEMATFSGTAELESLSAPMELAQ